MRTTALLLLLPAAALASTHDTPPDSESPRAARVREFPNKVASIAASRQALAERLEEASAEEREAIRDEARRVVVGAIVDDLFPAWIGTPWHMGEDDDATMPHQAGKRVSCSMFVTAVLQNAGLRLDSRRRWAASPALHIQRSLAPERRDLLRFRSISPAELARRLGRRPDGLYVIGLNVHVGFIRVTNGEARFIHSSYVTPEVGVIDEPVAESEAIAYSQEVGYWVTPLFQDDRLVDHWLRGADVPLQKLGM